MIGFRQRWWERPPTPGPSSASCFLDHSMQEVAACKSRVLVCSCDRTRGPVGRELGGKGPASAVGPLRPVPTPGRQGQDSMARWGGGGACVFQLAVINLMVLLKRLCIKNLRIPHYNIKYHKV